MESEKKAIHCSFCGKGRHQVTQMIEGPALNGETLYICDECVEITYNVIHTDESSPKSKKKEKVPNPEEIKEHLDRYIIGQDNAKVAISVAIYNHYKRVFNKDEELEKSNLLMIGSSGSGKTLTVKTIAKIFDLPFIIADATSLTEAGYVGEDVEELVSRLVIAADDDVEKAQRGIIFIDEIDKKSRRNESSNVRDVSGEGVQQALLKITEGTKLIVEDSGGDDVEIDTKNILFIFSGAFVGLDETMRQARNKTSIGLNSTLKIKTPFADVVKDVTPDDLIKYGLIPEFVGRCPITIVFDDLNEDMLVRILKEPKNSLVSQFKTLFKYDGVNLDFDDKYLLNVASECLKQKTGARGLRTVIEKTLQSTQFVLPRLAKEGLDKVVVDANGTTKYIYKVKKIVNDE